ncbi:MAG: DUF4142 domain-containing protein [Gemmatimonadaceae bacterium]
MRLASRTAACLAALVLAAGCHRGAMQASAPAAGPRVTDANVVAIVLAANNTDLSYARLVPARSRNADVRAFAERMTTDHTILNARANDIAQRNRILAEDDEISLDFRDHSAQRRDALRELDGARFDSAYAENEVQYHTELLSALNAVLGPQTRNAELREFVMNLKPAVTAHLAHAEQMRAGLSKKK